jgi:hypothetical protein
MPSSKHEGIIELVRRRPEMPAEFLHMLKVRVPEFAEARVVSADLSDLKPPERRADTAVVLYSKAGTPVLAVVVEVQLRRDEEKWESWPDYLTGLRRRYHCDAMLLVVAPSQRVARWAARPIRLGHPHFILWPLVVGPDLIPRMTDLDEARRAPELAILSGIAHAEDEKVRIAAFMAVNEIAGEDMDLASMYADLILAEVPEKLRKTAEAELLSHAVEYQSEFALRYFNQGVAEGVAQGVARGIAEGVARGMAEGVAEGKALGESESVLAVLSARGVRVTPEAEARIRACHDTDELGKWLARAATAESISDVLD